MKRSLLLMGMVLAFGFLLMLEPPALASAKQLSVDYSFDRPEISGVMIGGERYDRVTMPGIPNCGNAGQPALPAKGARILLPFGTEVSSIEIVPAKRVSLGSGYFIEPVSKPIRLSADPGSASPPTPNSAIYDSSRPFPETQFLNIGTQGFRGYQTLNLKLQPVQYIPTSGELYYYPYLTVVVNTVDNDRLNALFRGLPEDEVGVLKKIDNPKDIDSYTAVGILGAKNYDMLILTTTSLAGAFQPLKDYHDAAGIMTEIHTTTDVGSNDPDDVRNYIKNRYLNDGIQYVIIGADDDIIPAKDLYVVSDDGSWPDIIYDMPADLYFACLDGTYNYDGDSYWGEPNDGEGGGDVDLIAEVYVGRASVGNSTEATRFVNKTIWYLNNQHSHLEYVQMAGEYLGFGGPSEYAAETLDELIDSASTHGYSTIGIPSDQYIIDRLYDRDWPGNDWPKSELISRINEGRHILNHLGHGSPDYAMKLNNSDIMNSLTNDDLCFFYSQTCLAGHFDGTDCWAEYMNIKTDNGGFAGIMNARYGWGRFNSTDGPSQRFNREFWDAVFNTAEGMPELGRANQDSKEDNLYRINEDCMRWCYYELNLFGDPTIAIKGVRGVTFDYPNSIPQILTPGQTTSFEVVVSGVGEGVPVSGSGQLHYSIDGVPFVTESMYEGPPNHYEAILPALNCGSTIQFYFTAEEDSGDIFSDPRNAPDETYGAFPVTGIVVVFDDNFETNQGWTVSGDASDGHWERAIPAGGGDRGDPPTDYDGSSKCYVTDNEDGNSDVDDGYTYLASPTIDLSQAEDAQINYALWYTNNEGDNPHNDLFKTYVSNNNGVSWVLAETIGPATSSGWVEHSFNVTDFVTLTDQIRIRFEASDLSGGSIVEAGIDAVSIEIFECNPASGGTIAGTVTDGSEPIAGVQVYADDGSGNTGSDVTIGDGTYSINLPASTYDVSFSHVNYRDTTITGVIVNEDETTTVDVIMEEIQVDIPTLSEWGMIIMALLLLATGTAAVIRRSRVISAGKVD